MSLSGTAVCTISPEENVCICDKLSFIGVDEPISVSWSRGILIGRLEMVHSINCSETLTIKQNYETLEY